MWLCVWMVLGCSGDDEVIPKGTVDTEPTGDTSPIVATADTAPVSTDIVLTSEGFQVTSSFVPGSVTAQEGQDLLFSWPSLTQDARGRPMVPADVKELVLVEMSVAGTSETLALLNGRGLTPEDALEWWAVPIKAQGFVNLSDLVARGAPFVPSAYFTTVNNRGWLLMLRNEGGEVLHAVSLVPGAGGTAVPIDNSSSSWSWAASPGAGVSGLVGDAPRLDWSGALNLYGDPVDPEIADLAFVAKLPSGTIVDVETALSIAEIVYTREVEGDTEAELSFLRGPNASTFAGFDQDGDWVIGLSCGTCSGSVPLLLVEVDVASR